VRLFPTSVLGVCVLLAACGGSAPADPGRVTDGAMTADLLITARRVVTLEPGDGPAPTAVAVRDGRVTWVGPAEAFTGAAARRLDRPNAVVVPGLVDSHAHLTGLGRALAELDVTGTRSADEVADKVRAVKGEGWVTGRGWDQNDWPVPEFPGRAPLDAASPARPVALTRIDGHALWVNAAALKAAGVDANTPDPPGGRILRDAGGEPTGVLIDAAMDLVRQAIPPPTPGQLRAWIAAAVAECHRVGLTGMHDAGASAREVAAMRELAAAGELPLRVHVMLYGEDPEIAPLLEAGPQPGEFVSISGVKLFADGALGSRGAWLLEPYADAPGTRGIPILNGDALRSRVRVYAGRGFQVGVHAIGDAAARDVLDAFAAVLTPGGDRRFRIEHAQIVTPEDQQRMADLGVLALVQTTHATSDMPWAERRLGPERIRNAYAWRSLKNRGVRLSLGSDFPVERPDPVQGLYAAVTRRDAAGQPAGGWYPEEALTAEEALRGFTVDAAYAGFAEHRRGRIAPGMDADFTLLDEDPLTVPPDRLDDLRVRGVVVAGRVVLDLEGE
jgi:predicted amidohydrolase YtcJ